MVYACTDFCGAVLWVDACQHQLMGRWEKSILLQPLLTAIQPSSSEAPAPSGKGAGVNEVDHDSLSGLMDQSFGGVSGPAQQAACGDKATAVKRVGDFEADGDWSELTWSTDGLQLACVGQACLAVISLVPSGQARSRVIWA